MSVHPAMQNRIIAAAHPDRSRTASDYLFVTPMAELRNGRWVLHQSPVASFPPQGSVYVDAALVPAGFRQGQFAAWEIEDQPDYEERGITCRYRAIRLAEPPIEIVSISCDSDDEQARDRALAPMRVASYRSDQCILAQFSNGWCTKVRLVASADRTGESRIDEFQLRRPLEAWGASESLARITLQSGSATWNVCVSNNLPSATQRLDLATVEEAFADVAKPGGLGKSETIDPAEVRRWIKALRSLIAGLSGVDWQVRRQRLHEFLERADAATDEQEKWSAEFQSSSLFKNAVTRAIATRCEEMREEIRNQVLNEEVELKVRLADMEVELAEMERITSKARDHSDHRGEAGTASLARSIAILEPPAAPANGRHRSGESNGDGDESVHKDSPTSAQATDCTELTTPLAIREHLEANLARACLVNGSAKAFARDVTVGLLAGQLVLFRGSLAWYLAEVVAQSLCYDVTEFRSIPLGAREPLTVLSTLRSGPSMILLEGVNRSCPSAFAATLTHLVQERVMRRARDPFPFLLGTLVDGPATLPVGPEFVRLGPVFDTDCLAWNIQSAPEAPEPGICRLAESSETPATEDMGWDHVANAIRPSDAFWQFVVHTAWYWLQKLSDSDRERNAAMLFGWILPRLFATDESPGLLQEGEKAAEFEAAMTDPRVKKLLRTHEWRSSDD